MADTKDQPSGSNTDDIVPIQPPTPIPKRLLFTVAAFAIHNVLSPTINTLRVLKGRIAPSGDAPTLEKAYPCRPSLRVRIFFPKTYDRAASPPKPLPLLFSIHGGGFVVGEPMDNDPFNARFSETHSALVVALNYAKAPTNPFPGQQLDVETLIDAVLRDPELAPHIDPAKVGMTGFSAGGNLVMAVAQVPAVRDRITAGAVPVYPVLDFSVKDKTQTRRYKASLGGLRGRDKDSLLTAAALFNWAYIPVGTDLCKPSLSPFFAERSDLPKRVWVVSCELDLLGHEGWRSACKWAGKPIPGLDQRIGQEEPADGGKLGTMIWTGDERFHFDVKDQNGEVRWLLIPDACHGFEMMAPVGGNADDVQDGKLKMEALIDEMGKWLFVQ